MKERRRIWIPEAPMVNLRHYREVGILNQSIGIEGWFDVELVHARTGLVKRSLSFRNVITDAGLDRVFTIGSLGVEGCVRNLAVGTGSTEPSVEDTSLVAEIARTNSDGGFPATIGTEGNSDAVVYRWRRITRVFTEAQANGNLTELGFFDSAGTTLWNRQLFRDELGAPTTITKTEEDQLRVRFEYRIYPPWSDSHQQIPVNGNMVDVTVRASGVSGSSWAADMIGANYLTNFLAYTGPIGGRGGSPSGTQAAHSSRSAIGAYVPGTFSRSFSTTWSPAVANFAVRSILFSRGTISGSYPSFQVEFSPPIEKTDTERLIIQNQWTFGRYDPEE